LLGHGLRIATRTVSAHWSLAEKMPQVNRAWNTARTELEDAGLLYEPDEHDADDGGYLDQIELEIASLPSLGEAGVEIAVLADLVPNVRVVGWDPEVTARVKGDLRMIDVVAQAVRDRERPLRETLRVPYGVQHLTMSVAESERIIQDARRRFRTHNAGRRHVGKAPTPLYPI
jgi:elongation factor P hydroxylase